MKTIDKIRDFIAKGETEKAVELLVQYTKESKPDLQNDAVLLSSRYQQWKRSVTIGVNESSNDLRHIENGILTMLENSSVSSTPTTAGAPTPTKSATTTTSQSIPTSSLPSKSSTLMPIVIGLLGLGALLMIGFWMFGDDHADDDIANHDHPTTEVPKNQDSGTKAVPVNTKPKKPELTSKGDSDTEPTTTKIPEVTQSPIQQPISKPAPKVLPKVNGKNVNLIEVDAGLYYRHIGNKKWLESHTKTLKSKNNFVETARDDYSVYLYDQAREVTMQIDLYRKKMTYADSDTKKRDQFDVVNAMEKAKGMQVIKAEYAKGYFEFKSGKTWEEKERGTNKVIDTFTEMGRDEWSVYMTNSGKDIQLDLNTKKVMYNEKGKSLAPLYDITAVY